MLPLASMPSNLPRLARGFAVSSFLAVTLLGPEATAAESDARIWLTTIGTMSLPGDFKASLFAQVRAIDDVDDFERLLLNPSISKSLGKGVSAAFGYDAHILRNPRVRVEHRTWQQLVGRHPLAMTTIVHRVRLEQRYIEGEDGAASRLRHLFEVRLPIANSVASGVTGVLRNEIFLDLDAKRQGPTQAGFGETRGFIGIDKRFDGRLNGLGAELGYQLQFVQRRRRADIAAHTLSIVLRYGP